MRDSSGHHVHHEIITSPLKKSMKKDQELIVITKTYDLVLWSCNHTTRAGCTGRERLIAHRIKIGPRKRESDGEALGWDDAAPRPIGAATDQPRATPGEQATRPVGMTRLLAPSGPQQTSPGQRPGKTSTTHLRALKGRNNGVGAGALPVCRP